MVIDTGILIEHLRPKMNLKRPFIWFQKIQKYLSLAPILPLEGTIQNVYTTILVNHRAYSRGMAIETQFINSF